MIDLYTWPTPNGLQVHLMLEECRLPYAVNAVDIAAAGQHTPEFLALSPNGTIPALLDSEGPDSKPIALFESGAILLYLAGKTGRFLPRSVRGRYQMLQWLMFQMASFGPTLAQARHTGLSAPDQSTCPIDRDSREARRLVGAIDRELARTGAFVAGRQYSIADMAIFPWLRSPANPGIDLDDFPQVRRWLDTLESRPAVRRAYSLLAEYRGPIADGVPVIRRSTAPPSRGAELRHPRAQ